MRRLKAFAAALLVITLLLCCFFTATGANRSSVMLFNDTSGTFVCETQGKNVTVFDVNNSVKYSYTFDYDVLTCCVSGGKLYAAMYTNQEGIVLVVSAKNGKIIGETAVIDKNIPKNTEISVDSSGNIYLINKKNNVDIFDTDGTFLRTSDKSYVSITPCGGKTYAANSAGIYLLSAKSDKKLCDCHVSSFIYAVSDNYIANNEGKVISVDSGKAVLSTDIKKLYSIAESSDYLLALNGKTIYAYSKNDGAYVNSYELNSVPFALYADGEKIFVLQSGGLSFNTINQKAFKKQESNQDIILPDSSTKSDSSSKVLTKGIDFGSYKVSGRYIFLEPQTKRSDFKSGIFYEGYTLSFSKHNGLGTGTKAVFSRNGKDYVYTIIVKGDITGTGMVNNRDISVMFNILFGLDKVGGAYKIAADMNGDGKLSNVDLVMIDRKRNLY